MTAPRSSGQAVLELAVALFSLVLVVVGVLAAGLLSRAGSQAMVEAQLSVLGSGASVQAGEAPALAGIAGAMAPDEAGREALQDLAGAAGADSGLGRLVGGLGGGMGSDGMRVARARVVAQLPPAAKPLLGLEEGQPVVEEVWMPPTGGL